MKDTDHAEVIAHGDILVVDDAPGNLKLLVKILTQAGYRVRPASNGELALRSVRAKPPALVLLDVKMPEMDGFEVCRRLQFDEVTRDIPIIFLSGLAETTEKSKGFSLGAVDYITKPFHEEEVLARVRLHLALSTAREQLTSKNLQLEQANEQLTSEITERERAQDALREGKDRLEGIYASVGDGIVTIDTQQRIVMFNSAAARLFGHTAASVFGQPVSMLLPERFRSPHEKHILRFAAGGQSSRVMGKYGLVYGLRASGEEFPVEATISQSGVSPNKLFTVVLRDLTERRQAEQVREQLMKQLELLGERLATAQEEERHNTAYELHEELGQELATLKWYLGAMGTGTGGGKTETPHQDAKGLVVHAIDRIRKLVLDLEPREMETLGLHAAVRTYCEGQAIRGGFDLHIDAPAPDARAPRPVERACFRVLQEGLSNVLKHAKANQVRVYLHHTVDELELGIQDNGIGFDRNALSENTSPETQGLGLFGMQMRAKQVGGTVEIKSVPGEGTEVRAVFPLPVASAEPV